MMVAQRVVDATKAAVNEWEGLLDSFLAELSRDCRRETRDHVRAYVHALLSPVERRNSWQLAEQAGAENP
jgi:hypothetical protein